jgi:PAS domain S-box-containing protein
MKERTDEVRHLRRCINNLISLLSLPAIWSRHEPDRILDTLVDALASALRLDFAYVRLNAPVPAPPIQAIRVAPDRHNPGRQPQEVGRALEKWITMNPEASTYRMPDLLGEGDVSIARFWMGLEKETGVIAVGSRRADFPTDMETLLLKVAVNQAVIELQGSQVLAERKRAEEAMRRSEERFHHLVEEGVKDYAIYMLSLDGRVMTWNNGAQRIKGYRSEEILGKHFSIFYEQDDIMAGKPGQGLTVAAVIGRYEDEGWRIRQNGSRFWAHIVITSVKDEAGRHQGFTKVTRDMTERQRAEEELRRSEAYLAQGQRLSQTGSWAWNVSTQDLFW